MRNWTAAAVLGLTSVLVLGCDGQVGPDAFPIWVRLDGFVESGSGAPVEGAQLELRIMYDGPDAGGAVTCFGYHFPDEPGMAATDATGAYEIAVQGSNLAPPDCVEVRARPPAGSTLGVATDTIIPEWSAEPGAGPVNRLDIVLPD